MRASEFTLIPSELRSSVVAVGRGTKWRREQCALLVSRRGAAGAFVDASLAVCADRAPGFTVDTDFLAAGEGTICSADEQKARMGAPGVCVPWHLVGWAWAARLFPRAPLSPLLGNMSITCSVRLCRLRTKLPCHRSSFPHCAVSEGRLTRQILCEMLYLRVTMGSDQLSRLNRAVQRALHVLLASTFGSCIALDSIERTFG